VVDDVTRECIAAIPDTSISGRRVARELATLIERRGTLGMIVSDNGTELTSNAILTFTTERKLEWHYIAPGKPMQNGFIESFNGRMTSTKHARIRHLATGRPRHSPNTSPPQPTPALRHLKAPHGCRLLHLRQPAYQPKGLRFRLDESSVAGHPLYHLNKYN